METVSLRSFVMCLRAFFGVSLVRDPHVLDRWCVNCKSYFWGGSAFSFTAALKVLHFQSIIIITVSSTMSVPRWPFEGKHCCTHILHQCFEGPFLGKTSLNQHFSYKSLVDSRLCMNLFREIPVLWGKKKIKIQVGNLFASVLPFRLSPLEAVRIGEATNPGPNSDSFVVRFGVTNPTAIHNKSDNLASLGCDVLLLSETSATKIVQAKENAALRKLGFTSVFGAAAAPQMTQGNPDSLRGAATGVSIHARYPIRPSRIENLTTWWSMGRITQAFLYLGKLELQLITIYGYPSNLPNSRQKTNELLCHAIECATQTTHPTIFAGDWNHHPTKLEAAQTLFLKGYRSIESLYEQKYALPLPCTYDDSSKNDVALIPPELATSIGFIDVDKQRLFARHHPLIFELHIGEDPPHKQTWKLPDTWICYEPDPQLLLQHYDFKFEHLEDENFEPKAQLHALQLWSQAVESTIDKVIAIQNKQDPGRFPTKQLPQKCKGRCRPSPSVKKPYSRAIKQAWDGQYTPSVDNASMPLRQQTKQMRRVQSLKMRIKKYDCNPALLSSEIQAQLWEEWQAILGSTGFPLGFEYWIQQYFEEPIDFLHMPTFVELFQIEQILRYELDKLTYDIKVKSRQHAQFLRDMDIKKYGKKQAFQSVREPSFGLVQQLESTISVTGKILPDSGMGFVSMQIPPSTCLDLTVSCAVQGHKCDIISWQSPVLDLMMHDADIELPLEVKLEQVQHTASPADVAAGLGNYWNQFWNSNNESQLHNLTDWPDFLRFADNIPPLDMLSLETNSLEQWKKAIKSLKSGTARGVCGWSADELKSLTDPMILDLIAIFNRISRDGMPHHLMWAKTIPLAKEPKVFTPAKTRPITVLCLLYRLWGRVISQQVLEAWSNVFPKSITGFLPRRSPQSMLYHLQVKLEQVHMGIETQKWSGLTLDLVKCFNCLPRQPAAFLLRRLGIPDAVVTFWFSSMERVERWWLVNNQMFSTGFSTTGCPEGDTISVMVMLAINYLWTTMNQSPEAILNAFADNWSYATCNQALHRPILNNIIQVCQSLSLQIDWNKTWAWATSQGHKDSLKRVALELLPPAVTLQLVCHARELGYIMHYRCQQFRGTVKTRRKAALNRLKKLQASDAPMHVKAQIARASCIVKAMYGTETFALGERFFTTLRTGIAYALLGPKHNVQTHLTCMCLSRYLTDPELFVIQTAIRKAREYLVFANSADADAFYQVFVTSRFPAAQIIGPAAALKWYIGKLGWTMTRTGLIHIDAFFSLHLTESNLEDILLAAEDSWMEHVAVVMQSRHQCRNIPVIDHISTRTVFEKLPESAKRTVGIQMVGGYMVNNQKQHFDPQQSELCEYCTSPDSAHHRVLECEATASAREKYSEVVEFLSEHDPVHILFPVCYRDPAFEFHRTLHFRTPEPDIDLANLHSNSVVFTDGSCRHPVDPRHRRASFAAVTYAAGSFVTVAISHCPGKQTIPRAELAAVVFIEQHTAVAAIVTDSAYVVHVWNRLLKTQDIRTLHAEKNYDLLKKWWNVLHHRHSSAVLIKVKAHESLQAETPELSFHRQGNACADEAAKLVSSQMLPEFLRSLDNAYTEAHSFQKQLLQHFHMRYDMAMVRVQIQRQQQQRPRSDTCGLQWFCQYVVEEPQIFRIPEEAFRHVDASNWGTTFSALLLDWLATLKWPTDEPNKATAVGITWFELAINFQTVSQQSIPVSVKLENGVKEHRWQFEDQAIDLQQYAYSDLVFSLQGCIKHLQFLLQTTLLPPHKTQKVRSLHLLGGNAFRMGYLARPQMLYQTETMQCVQRYLNAAASTTLTFHEHPDLPKLPPLIFPRIFPPPGDNRDQRALRYKNRRRDIRLGT